MKAMPADAVSASLADLAALDRAGLAERWAQVFGCPAPRRVHANLLRGALAWQAQMAHQAGNGPGSAERSIRRLRRAMGAAPAPGRPSPGTRLLRDWQGQTHAVTVLAQGFEYQGQTYRSLTAIARQITGTAWSGPLFFGLRS